jgi:hypothetical protein
MQGRRCWCCPQPQGSMREVEHSLEITLNYVPEEVIEGDGEPVRPRGLVKIVGSQICHHYYHL